jgi:hypothetical protein
VPQLRFNPFSGTLDYVNRPGEKEKTGVVLVGAVDGSNVVFTTPTKFLVKNGKTIAVYLNGVRLTEGVSADYVITESGGLGSGHDTVVLAFPLKSTPTMDQLIADYTEL